MNSNFKKELSKLIADDVISIEIAKKIDNYYNSKQEPQSNKLLSIFGVLGSLLVGLGIILVLAHNWDNFSRLIKTIFAFIPLVIGQIVVGYSLLKKKSSIWLESSGTFLFLAVGSSISLVSQIYNIPGNLGSFLLTWLMLCLPLVYLLKSKSVFILCLAFTTYYAWELGYANWNNIKTPWMYLLIITTLLPFYITQLKYKLENNLTTVFNFLLPLSLLISFGTFVKGNYQFIVITYVVFFGLLYNLGRLNFFNNIRIRKNGFILLGSLGLVVTMLILSFKGFWGERLLFQKINNHDLIVAIVILITTIVLLIFNKRESSFKWNSLFEYASSLIALTYIVGNYNNLISSTLVNLIIFILGVSTIKKGVDKMNFGILNYGMLIITLLIICRFFDTEMTFVVRGLLFILVGTGFFATNFLMIKKMKKLN